MKLFVTFLSKLIMILLPFIVLIFIIRVLNGKDAAFNINSFYSYFGDLFESNLFQRIQNELNSALVNIKDNQLNVGNMPSFDIKNIIGIIKYFIDLFTSFVISIGDFIYFLCKCFTILFEEIFRVLSWFAMFPVKCVTWD